MPIRASVFADGHTGSPQSPQLLEFWHSARCYAVLCLFPQVHAQWTSWAVIAILCFETSSFRQFLQTMDVWLGWDRDIQLPLLHFICPMTSWVNLLFRVNQNESNALSKEPQQTQSRVKRICKSVLDSFEPKLPQQAPSIYLYEYLHCHLRSLHFEMRISQAWVRQAWVVNQFQKCHGVLTVCSRCAHGASAWFSVLIEFHPFALMTSTQKGWIEQKSCVVLWYGGDLWILWSWEKMRKVLSHFFTAMTCKESGKRSGQRLKTLWSEWKAIVGYCEQFWGKAKHGWKWAQMALDSNSLQQRWPVDVVTWSFMSFYLRTTWTQSQMYVLFQKLHLSDMVIAVKLGTSFICEFQGVPPHPRRI